MKKGLILIVLFNALVGFCLNGDTAYDRLDKALRDIPQMLQQKGYGRRIQDEIMQSLYAVQQEFFSKIRAEQQVVYGYIENLLKNMRERPAMKIRVEVLIGIKTISKWLDRLEITKKQMKNMSALSTAKQNFLWGDLKKLRREIEKELKQFQEMGTNIESLKKARK